MVPQLLSRVSGGKPGCARGRNSSPRRARELPPPDRSGRPLQLFREPIRHEPVDLHDALAILGFPGSAGPRECRVYRRHGRDGRLVKPA